MRLSIIVPLLTVLLFEYSVRESLQVKDLFKSCMRPRAGRSPSSSLERERRTNPLNIRREALEGIAAAQRDGIKQLVDEKVNKRIIKREMARSAKLMMSVAQDQDGNDITVTRTKRPTNSTEHLPGPSSSQKRTSKNLSLDEFELFSPESSPGPSNTKGI